MSFTSIALRCLACGGKLGSHFLWTGDGAYHHACFPSSPKEDELASLRAQVASLQKELAERTGERDRAKVIISKACNHLPNGAFCSPEASLDFMEHIPDEVLLVTSDLVGKVSSAESRADTLARRVEGLEAALSRIADPRNIHFAGDAQIVARNALAHSAALKQKKERKKSCKNSS